MSVFSVERIKVAMTNIATYLEQVAYPYPDVDSRITKALLSKGVKNYVFKPMGEDDLTSTHSFEYHGWRIQITEEICAISTYDGHTVFIDGV